MKLAGHVFLFTALLLVVTWLNVRSMDAEWRQAQVGLEYLDRFTLVESMLHRDLLSARAGLSLNYDPLVERLTMLRQVVDTIRDHVVGTGEREAAERLAGFADEEDVLTEQFKSRNALLHNSYKPGSDEQGLRLQTVCYLFSRVYGYMCRADRQKRFDLSPHPD